MTSSRNKPRGSGRWGWDKQYSVDRSEQSRCSEPQAAFFWHFPHHQAIEVLSCHTGAEQGKCFRDDFHGPAPRQRAHGTWLGHHLVTGRQHSAGTFQTRPWPAGGIGGSGLWLAPLLASGNLSACSLLCLTPPPAHVPETMLSPSNTSWLFAGTQPISTGYPVWGNTGPC